MIERDRGLPLPVPCGLCFLPPFRSLDPLDFWSSALKVERLALLHARCPKTRIRMQRVGGMQSWSGTTKASTSETPTPSPS